MPPPSQPLHNMNYGNMVQSNSALHTTMNSGGIKRRYSNVAIAGAGAGVPGVMSSPSPLLDNAIVNSSNGMGTPVPTFATIAGSNMQTTRDPSVEPHPGPVLLGSTAPLPSPSLSSAIAITPGTPTTNTKNPKKARHSSMASPNSSNKTLTGGNTPTTPAARGRKGSGKKEANKKKDNVDDHDPTKVGTPNDPPATSSHVGNIGSPGIAVSTHHQAGARMANVKGSPLSTASPAPASAVMSAGDSNNNNVITQDANSNPGVFAAGPDITNARQQTHGTHAFENIAPNYYPSITPHQVMLNSTDGTNGINMDPVYQMPQNDYNLVNMNDQGTGTNANENVGWATLDFMGEFLNPSGFDPQDGDVSSVTQEGLALPNSMGVNSTTV